FLPIDEGVIHPAFQRETATHPETLEPFIARVDDSAKTTFRQGVSFLTAGDFTKAEASFKQVINPDTDSTAPLAYLAASFAASGGRRCGRSSATSRSGATTATPTTWRCSGFTSCTPPAPTSTTAPTI